MADAYDYAIIGAGSAGCALARRLSDDPTKRVLLLEAGGSTDKWFVRMSAGFMKVGHLPQFFWEFPVDHLFGRSPETHKYGRGLGGSSAVNGMWYLRGMARDYDGWRDRGLINWGWPEVERWFTWMEDYRERGADRSRGRDGLLQITRSRYEGVLLDRMKAAFASLGLPWLDDINSPNVSGVGRTQFTVDRSGKRCSAWSAFVQPVAGRANLRVETDAIARRLVLTGGRVSGVDCIRGDGCEERFEVAGETIVSAGVYGSPALLQRSGIGAAQDLSRLGIIVEADLPAVGKNLCDHQNIWISYDLKNHRGENRQFMGWRLYRNALHYFATGGGRFARAGMPLTALCSTSGKTDWPDLQLAAAPFAMRTAKEAESRPGVLFSEKPGITFAGFDLRPFSRGDVRITSTDPRVPPTVRLDRWSDERDRAKSLVLLRVLRRLATSPALADYVGNERVPGSHRITDDELLEELAWMTNPGLHGTGTCGMGSTRDLSVLDGRCRVHGVGGLRVVDTSAMPTPVSGNTNGPAMMFGARAAELILEDARSSTHGV